MWDFVLLEHLEEKGSVPFPTLEHRCYLRTPPRFKRGLISFLNQQHTGDRSLETASEQAFPENRRRSLAEGWGELCEHQAYVPLVGGRADNPGRARPRLQMAPGFALCWPVHSA